MAYFVGPRYPLIKPVTQESSFVKLRSSRPLAIARGTLNESINADQHSLLSINSKAPVLID
jgi:hypothetical protein